MSGANTRPATAREASFLTEATVPWLIDSRCAREISKRSTHGQADCLAFFIAPGAFHQRKGERIKMSVNRSNRSEDPIVPRPATADVHIVDHHSIVLFHLNTPEASAWVEENTCEAQFFGTALAVEPRYVAALIAGMRE